MNFNYCSILDFKEETARTAEVRTGCMKTHQPRKVFYNV